MCYEPVPSERFFNSKQKYSDIVGQPLDVVIAAFEQRLRDWYIGPIDKLKQDPEHWQFAFAVMAMNCLLIDTLSQFEAGSLASDREIFVKFIKCKLPRYACPLTSPLKHWYFDGQKHKHCSKDLTDSAEVLYHGFRCGILHQAHAPLYCGVAVGATPIEQTIGQVKYAAVGGQASADCLSVSINPWHLFDELKTLFGCYIQSLKDADPKNDVLRDNFKKKFLDSFGVKI
jgi:hypothetical protein